MKKIIRLLIFAIFPLTAYCQEEGKVWSLQDCLDYAYENNIQLHKKRNLYLSGMEDTKQSKAALFPSLAASTSQKFGETFFGESTTRGAMYSGSYGLNADMTLYSGGKLRRQIKIDEKQNVIDSLSVEENINDIKIAIVRAYMLCLYSQEAVQICQSTLELSVLQRDRAVEMKNTGSISKVEVSQLESQVSNDRYDLVSAETQRDDYILQLKQLLELGISDKISLLGIDISEDEILGTIADKKVMYENALQYLPEVKSGKASIEIAEMSLSQAKAGYIPSLGLSAGLGTSHMSGAGNSFSRQITDNFALDAGLVLSIPISSNRQVKTAVNKSSIELMNSRLDMKDIEKGILEDVESSYLDAVSAQSQYISAREQEKYAQESYDLIDQQFQLGMKNIIEIIKAKNDLLSAQISKLQAKYMVILNLQILDIYQGLK